MSAARLRPSFEAGRRGRVHVMRFMPESVTPRWVVTVAQPFAEEANKARRMVALGARALVQQGCAVVVPDPYGSMDSEGDFGDARWDDWVSDLAAIATAEAERLSAPSMLWGVRAGALLARDALERLPDCRRLLLWAPVTSGEQALTQFLRLRTAASMMEGQRETARELRDQLAAGQSLEVAGYDLAPELARALEAARLAPPAGHPGGECDWFAVGPAPPPAVVAILEHWQAAGWSVQGQAVPGDAFWATQEIATVPELVQATAQCFETVNGQTQ